jgi:hypothetical protein
MPRDHQSPSTCSSSPSARPAGAPAWVTEELLSDTIVAWQPYYAEDLTADDALEILLAAGRLFDALGDAEHEEKQVPGSGSRQQP